MPIRTRPVSPCITTMVPYHRPIPERKQRGKADGAPSDDPAQGGVGGGLIPPQRRGPVAGGSGLIGAWVQAEKMIQIALVLPCAAFIGWLPGAWLDRHFHQAWMAIAGVVFGIIAGLVAAIRMAVVYANDPAMNKLDENGNEADKSDKTGDSGTAS